MQSNAGRHPQGAPNIHHDAPNTRQYADDVEQALAAFAEDTHDADCPGTYDRVDRELLARISR